MASVCTIKLFTCVPSVRQVEFVSSMHPLFGGIPVGGLDCGVATLVWLLRIEKIEKSWTRLLHMYLLHRLHQMNLHDGLLKKEDKYFKVF